MPNDLNQVMNVSASGLRAQSVRMRIIAQNIANADSIGQTPGAAPYRRQMAGFTADQSGDGGVQVTGVTGDPTPFVRRYEPGSQAADAQGYVLHPNVNLTLEQADMAEAQRSYTANLSVIEAAKAMAMRTIDLLK